MSEEIENHVLERYDISKKLGRGAYGIVWKAVDKRTKKTVALKKVFEAFQNSVDAQRTYREVMYLQELNGHENIVRLLGIIRAHNNRDLYLVFEYMETDLHAVIKAKILQSIHKQFIFYQLLKSLKYIHTADLIHRDLKPSNLLINSECTIKVADFGLARSVAQKDDGKDPIVSDYVATRWYRAPEILLGSQCYNKAVDMWSAGCILAELITGKVLFTGKSTINQIELVIELLGRPTNEEIETLGSPLAWNVLSNITAQKTRSFTQTFSGEGKEALDLLRRLLTFSPKDRMTVEEALRHPWVKSFHCEADEISCKKIIKLSVDDNTKLSLKEYREAIYKDINDKTKQSKKGHPENLPKINDKIKSIASREKNDPDVSTTLGDKRSAKIGEGGYRGEEDILSRPRRTVPEVSHEASRPNEKLKVHRSFDFGTKGDSKLLKEPSAVYLTSSAVAAPQAKLITGQSKNQYKSLEVSMDKATSKPLEGSKWFRPASPGVLIPGKRMPSRQEESHSQSLSKINVKANGNSLVLENSRIKRSGYILQASTSQLGHAPSVSMISHKKSNSQAAPVHISYKSPGKDRVSSDIVNVLGAAKKSGSNYFFKKQKSKLTDDVSPINDNRLRPSKVASQKSFNQPAYSKF